MISNEGRSRKIKMSRQREPQQQSPVISISEDADIKVKALADEIRRDIIAVLYTRGPLFNNQLADAVHIKPSHLAYHLNLLLEADYVKKEFTKDRVGKSFAMYSVTDAGVRFLEFIGAKKKLDELRENMPKAFGATKRVK